MRKTRPLYPAESRQQIIELALAGRSPAELLRKFGPTIQTILNWLAKAARDAGKPLPDKVGLRRRSNARNWCACVGNAGSSRWSATSWQRLRLGSSQTAIWVRRPLLARDGQPGGLSWPYPVPRAEGLVQWLLRLARAQAQPARDPIAVPTKQIRAAHAASDGRQHPEARSWNPPSSVRNPL